ncbi:ABC transporter permease [Trueperella abortisuis]|uniref:Transport permease protein n=1 Tax=Trueperella abortisuis TaxID=445930 RepID=A0ABT9PL70_9ACTO|nr:ABC transporter permease [Trueperella abortisuis]MDP9832875.1 teichoic acid transport system permease protein [Trueperella abortisuis]
MTDSTDDKDPLELWMELIHPESLKDSREIVAAVDARKFLRLSSRPLITAYVRDVWHRRHFTLMESKARAFGSIKDTALGKAWLILEPFLNSAIYYFIFAVLLSFDRGMDNFVAFLVIGLISFTLLSKGLNATSAIEGSGRNLVKSFQFPKFSLVLSYTLRTYYDFVPTVIAMIIFIVVIPPHALPTTSWTLVPLVYLLVAPLAIGIASITATLATLLPDIRFIIGLFSRLWFYASGIFWSVDMFADKPFLQDLMRLNPACTYLDILRTILLTGSPAAASQWVYLTVWSITLFVVGFLFLWRSEVKMSKALER